VKEKLGGQCQVLAMRDTDLGFTTVFITQIDSPIRSLQDLQGKRLALASRHSSHAAILPLYFLHQNGILPDKDLTLLRFDTDVGKHGDTGTSEEEVVRARLSFSKQLTNHIGAIRYFTCDYNLTRSAALPR
jgi:phosphonate transport system substrate-binding protein